MPSVRFEYNGDDPQVVDLSTLPVDPATGRKQFTLPVEEGRLIGDELVGVSDGTPNQRFQLPHTPLILRAKGVAGQINHDITIVTAPRRSDDPVDAGGDPGVQP